MIFPILNKFYDGWQCKSMKYRDIKYRERVEMLIKLEDREFSRLMKAYSLFPGIISDRN